MADADVEPSGSSALDILSEEVRADKSGASGNSKKDISKLTDMHPDLKRSSSSLNDIHKHDANLPLTRKVLLNQHLTSLKRNQLRSAKSFDELDVKMGVSSHETASLSSLEKEGPSKRESTKKWSTDQPGQSSVTPKKDVSTRPGLVKRTSMPVKTGKLVNFDISGTGLPDRITLGISGWRDRANSGRSFVSSNSSGSGSGSFSGPSSGPSNVPSTSRPKLNFAMAARVVALGARMKPKTALEEVPDDSLYRSWPPEERKEEASSDRKTPSRQRASSRRSHKVAMTSFPAQPSLSTAVSGEQPQPEPSTSDDPMKERKISIGCDMHHKTPGDCPHCQYALLRGNWCYASDHIFSLLAYTTSLGNFLRFPFLCVKNGGGAFLLPYMLFMVVAGIPVVFLETSFGQFAGVGTITAWKVSPLFRGLGWGMVLCSAFVSIHNGVMISWCMFYTVSGMSEHHLWLQCNSSWNSPGCCDRYAKRPCSSINDSLPSNATCLVCDFSNAKVAYTKSQHIPLANPFSTELPGVNITWVERQDTSTASSEVTSFLTQSHTQTKNMDYVELSKSKQLKDFLKKHPKPADEFFRHRMLQRGKEPVVSLGALRWQLALALVLICFITFLALIRGVCSAGKIGYITQILSYGFILVLLVRTSVLEGSLDGLSSYLRPNWSKLQEYTVWRDAAVHTFYSVAIGLGGLSTLASYNTFSHNCYRDSVLVALSSALTSILASLPVFFCLGHMTLKLDFDLTHLIPTYRELIFVSFPEALSFVSGASGWTVIFFLLLVLVGLDTQVTLVHTILAGIMDEWAVVLYSRRLWVLLSICLTLFLFSLPLVTQQGVVLVDMIEKCLLSWPMLWLGLCECLAVCWVYGYTRYSQDICLMFGKHPGKWWCITWKFISPLVIVFTICISHDIFSAEVIPQLPQWSFLTGWTLVIFCLIWIPFYTLYSLIRTPGTLWQRLKSLSKHVQDWNSSMDPSATDPGDVIPEYIRSDPEDTQALLEGQDGNGGTENPALDMGDDQSFDLEGVRPRGRMCDEIDTGSIVWEEEENKERGNWTGRHDFILASLGYCIGLGNVWRFPYLVYKNGGGAFFVAYFVMLLLCGFPLVYLELAFGQFASTGPLTIWKVSPIFKGVGYCAVITIFFISIYYNVINAWSLYYLFASMTSELVWQHCNNTWNSPDCLTRERAFQKCLSNDTGGTNLTQNCSETVKYPTPTEEYFFAEVLRMDNMTDFTLGSMTWHLALCLLLSWVIIFLTLLKGIKSVGKVVHITVTFPYIILLVLLIRYVTLGEGHLEGIRFYVTPEWSRLADATVWGDAASQLFFSLGLSVGGLIALSSYNRFHYDCFRDTYIICLMDTLTSIFAGFVIFAILGVMAKEANVKVTDVTEAKFTLAYIVYPEAVSKLPVAPLWSILFFLMLILLAVDSQFLMVETIVIAIMDEFGHIITAKRRWMLVLVLCILMYLLGLPMCTKGGIWLLILMDTYVAAWGPLLVGFFTCVAIGWVYGVDYFCSNIRAMLGKEPTSWWRNMWRICTPLTLLFIFIFSMLSYSVPKFNGEIQLPFWAEVSGIFLSVLSALCIPVVAVKEVVKHWGQGIRNAFFPQTDWGPALRKFQESSYAPGAKDLHIPSFSAILALTEQSIFATEASLMFGAPGKHQSQNNKPSEPVSDDVVRRETPDGASLQSVSLSDKNVQTGESLDGDGLCLMSGSDAETKKQIGAPLELPTRRITFGNASPGEIDVEDNRMEVTSL